MPNLSDRLARELIDHQINLLRYSASAYRDVEALLADIQEQLAERLTRSHLSYAARARLEAVLRDVRIIIERGYGSIDAAMSSHLAGLTQLETQVLAGIVNDAVGVSIMESALPRSVMRQLLSSTMIMGAPSSQWWLRQAQGLTFEFTRQMRLGIAMNETNQQLVARVRNLDGIMQQPRRAAEALVRTSVQEVANAATITTFKENKDVLKGWQQVSTLDSRTTDICIAYDGASWDLRDKPINGTTLPFVNEGGSPHGCPRHWNCRSRLVPLVKTWRELGIDADEFTPSVRASMDGEVAAKLTYEDWLKGKDAAMQDKVLGVGKAALWRAGKITMRDLLNQAGRPLTLAQLQTKYHIQPGAH